MVSPERIFRPIRDWPVRSPVLVAAALLAFIVCCAGTRGPKCFEFEQLRSNYQVSLDVAGYGGISGKTETITLIEVTEGGALTSTRMANACRAFWEDRLRWEDYLEEVRSATEAYQRLHSTLLADASRQRPPTQKGEKAPVSTESLLELERGHEDAFVFHKGTSAHSFDESTFFPLAPYYIAANENLFKLFRELASCSDCRRVVYVQAPAGFGKSPLIQLIKNYFPDAEPVLDLKRWVEDQADATTVPDLLVRARGKRVVMNRLPALSGPLTPERFAKLVFPPVTLLDSIDEIQPDLARHLLRQIDEAVDTADSRFIVAVFGRPEGFARYLSSSNAGFPSYRTVHELRAPVWRTSGDIENLTRGYFTYRKEPFLATNAQNLFELVRKNPFLGESIQLLSQVNFLIRQQYAMSTQPMKLKQELVSEMLHRNSGTHNRPDGSSTTLNDYKALLRSIAQEFASNVGFAADGSQGPAPGYFEVPYDHVVRTDNEVEARTWSLLDRSGLATFAPIDESKRWYRFTPFWLHRFLAEDE